MLLKSPGFTAVVVLSLALGIGANTAIFTRLLPHVQACAELLGRGGLEFPEAPLLLNHAGFYLYERARYAEAEPLLQRALAIVEEALGPEHPHVATSLNNLARLYHGQGRYREAEPLYRQALEIREKVLEQSGPSTLQRTYQTKTYGSWHSSCESVLAIPSCVT